MDTKSEFLHKIEEEYDDFLEMIDGYNTVEIVNNSAYIAAFQAIYMYLSTKEPLTDEQMMHLLKVSNPIELLVNSYNPSEEETHEEFFVVCERVVNDKIYASGCTKKVNELFDRMNNELQAREITGKTIGDGKDVFEYFVKIATNISDYLAESLMQFKNSIEVICAATNESDSFKNVRDETIMYIENNDIFTLPHKLDHDKIMPESKYRHDAIMQITNLVPKPDFKETMAWVDFYRQVMGDVSDNPYKELVQVFEEISNDYDSELLQQIYESNNSTMMLHNELRVLAHYLADGGDIEKVYDMRDQDMFLQSYEDLKELLEAQEQGSMNMC